MLDCRELQTQGVGSGRYLGEALPAESLRSNKSLTSPTGGPQGLGRRPKRGVSRDDPGELTVKFGASKLRDASVAAVAGAVAGPCTALAAAQPKPTTER